MKKDMTEKWEIFSHWWKFPLDFWRKFDKICILKFCIKNQRYENLFVNYAKSY